MGIKEGHLYNFSINARIKQNRNFIIITFGALKEKSF
jgi:hypothetical protein